MERGKASFGSVQNFESDVINVVFEERKLMCSPLFLFLKMNFFQTKSQWSSDKFVKALKFSFIMFRKLLPFYS